MRTATLALVLLLGACAPKTATTADALPPEQAADRITALRAEIAHLEAQMPAAQADLRRAADRVDQDERLVAQGREPKVVGPADEDETKVSVEGPVSNTDIHRPPGDAKQELAAAQLQEALATQQVALIDADLELRRAQLDELSDRAYGRDGFDPSAYERRIAGARKKVDGIEATIRDLQTQRKAVTPKTGPAQPSQDVAPDMR